MEFTIGASVGVVTPKGIESCEVCISPCSFSWSTIDLYHEHDLTFVIGARVSRDNPYDFSVCIYKHTRKVFQEHVFRTDSYELSARLTLNLMLTIYSGRPRQKVAILVNPISGKKLARKMLQQYLMPVFSYSPSIIMTFGDG